MLGCPLILNGLVKGDHSRKAQRDLLEVAGGGLDDQLADLGGTGERDLVDVGMGGQSGTGGFAKVGLISTS